jgi:hypothetical protein
VWVLSGVSVTAITSDNQTSLELNCDRPHCHRSQSPRRGSVIVKVKRAKDTRLRPKKLGPMSPMIADVAPALKALLSRLPVQWGENYADALQTAATLRDDPSSGSGIVIAYFSGSDWCPRCIALDAEVFDSATFRAWFNTLDGPAPRRFPRQ